MVLETIYVWCSGVEVQGGGMQGEGLVSLMAHPTLLHTTTTRAPAWNSFLINLKTIKKKIQPNFGSMIREDPNAMLSCPLSIFLDSFTGTLSLLTKGLVPFAILVQWTLDKQVR